MNYMWGRDIAALLWLTEYERRIEELLQFLEMMR